MTTLKNCILPDQLLYDVDRDLWAERQTDGSIRIGLTDVGQTRAGKIRHVSFPGRRLGKVVDQSRSLALVESAKWVGPIPAPARGRLVETNGELLEHPLLINLDPYGAGWIVRFRPEEPVPWAHGEDAIAQYAARLGRTFRSVAGENTDFWCIHCNDWDDV